MSNRNSPRNWKVRVVRDFVAKYGPAIDENFEQEALQNERIGVLACLLANGLDLNKTSVGANFGPMWFWVFQNPNPRVLAKALAAGADITKACQHGRTAVHHAANMSVEHLKIVLEAGADIHARTIDGVQAIHEAATNQRVKILEILLQYGADPNSRCPRGWSPLWLCMRRRNHWGSALGTLIRAGADINEIGKDGTDILFNTIRNRSPEELRDLIVAGVDVHQKDPRWPWQIWDYNYECTRVVQILACLYTAGADISDIRLDVSTVHNQSVLTTLLQHCRTPLLESPPQCVYFFERACRTITRGHSARIIEVCIALQPLRLPALQLCEIVQAVLWFWPRLRFHDIWNRVVAVRHFHERRRCR